MHILPDYNRHSPLLFNEDEGVTVLERCILVSLFKSVAFCERPRYEVCSAPWTTATVQGDVNSKSQVW